MFSGVQVIKAQSAVQLANFAIMHAVLAALFFIPLMLLAWAVTPPLQRLFTHLFERCVLTVNHAPHAMVDASRWTWRSTSLFRDVVFVALYLLLIAYLVFWPSSRISYNLDGRDLIVRGEITDFGLRFYLYLFALSCLQSIIYLVIARMVDAFLKLRT